MKNRKLKYGKIEKAKYEISEKSKFGLKNQKNEESKN